MMASTLADNVSTSPAPLADNPSRIPPRLRARAPMIASGYSYPGRPDRFRHLIAQHRPRRPAEAYLRLRSLPGEQAQVDWGHFGHLQIGRARRPLMAFVMVLSHGGPVAAEQKVRLRRADEGERRASAARRLRRRAENHPLMHNGPRSGRLWSPDRSLAQQLVHQSVACKPLACFSSWTDNGRIELLVPLLPDPQPLVALVARLRLAVMRPPAQLASTDPTHEPVLQPARPRLGFGGYVRFLCCTSRLHRRPRPFKLG